MIEKCIKRRKQNDSIMCKNVTDFKHFLKNPCINEKDINWAIHLRDYNPRSKSVIKLESVPEVYHKKTQNLILREQQFNRKDPRSQINSYNTADYYQFMHKNQPKSINYAASTLEFCTSLRKGKNKDLMNNQPFDCIPKMDRGEQPQILKKTNIKKIKQITKEDQDQAIDGDHNYPMYTEKILKNRNVGYLSSFTKIKGRGSVNLPGLAWQVGLRNY